MYNRSTFKFRAHIKTNVYKSIHISSEGRKMVIVEGISVCMWAWMFISSVPESTFYRYQEYARKSREAVDHGNIGLLKLRMHTK